MVVALEQAKFTEEQLAASNGQSAELIQQKEMSTKMGEMQDKACKEQIKAATPTFMQRLQQNFLAGGIGAAIAAVVILLL
jgi:hypothetical protein